MAQTKQMPEQKTSILWLRRDLRLADNQALARAHELGGPIIALFILDDASGVPERLGAAARWWLHHSLKRLSAALERCGSRLILRSGRTSDILLELCKETGSQDIFSNRLYSPRQDRIDADLTHALADNGITLHSSAGHLLHEPRSITTKSGQPFKVFTPFWRAMASGTEPALPLDAPTHLQSPSRFPASDSLEEWALLPTKPNWASKFTDEWQPGEEQALERLEEFIDYDVKGYSTERDIPASDRATSRLSPHLAFGEISPATIWHGVSKAPASHPSQDLTTFRKELAWRDFCYGLFQIEPDLSEKN
jgi:deoxyribodipyrimidine photo-lyase